MKKIIYMVLILVTLISSNVWAVNNKYIDVRYIKKGKTVKLQTYDGKLKVQLYKQYTNKVKYKHGLTQLVTVWFKITAPKGLIPYTSDYDFEKELSKNKAYKLKTKVYTIKGKAFKTWYPAHLKLYDRFIWDYYYDKNYDEEYVKSWIVEACFLKRPQDKYIVGIIAADKKYKNRKSMPKRYRIDDIDSWFTKHKEYTVFTKIS